MRFSAHSFDFLRRKECFKGFFMSPYHAIMIAGIPLLMGVAV